ncbi:aa3-type cytochrome c oxidase subunit IV [Aurantimonas aggregata]|uniref:Aa3-type cytochrome c oxidase subunit IV n=1 Tax=Aurantimonas aggregata TaxID=2047720 RepID=A0A6L9MDW4_9HYPH|nr:aa3-type cytochrome c oxidase subunit IV [Aurantimonas aggregata]NDV85846.1 aa3-type cytochrome c oxidase subunit IV [Aurantimonas aggregata]
MAGSPEFDINHPAEMDYPEHERTYSRFLAMTKWGSAAIIAILVGMLVGLIMGAGVIASVFSFLIVLVIAWVIFR